MQNHSVKLPQKTPWRELRRSLGLLLLCLFVYHANLRPIASYDSLAAGLLPFNLWQGKGFVLDDHGPRYPRQTGYSMIRGQRGEWVSVYPVVTPLLVLPLYLPAAFVPAFAPDNPRYGYLFRLVMEKLAAALLTAFSVVVLERVLRRVVAARTAFWLSLVYAFATPAWAVSSQALWPHAAAQLLLALALLLLERGETVGWPAFGLGLLAGLLTANRPLDLVFSAALLWIVLRRSGRRAWPFVLASTLVAVLLLSYNAHFFSSLMGGYGDFELADPKDLAPRLPTVESLSGLLVSKRGLLVFCPFLIFLAGWRLGSGRSGCEAAVLAAAWVANYGAYAAFTFWSAGACYGPRYASDGLPLLFLFLAPAVERWRGPLGRAVLAATVGWAVWLQAIGAFCFPGGDSGNDIAYGPWDVARSAPLMAAFSGPQSPVFLPARLLPGVGMKRRLEVSGVQARLEWIEPPPHQWPAGTARLLVVEIENRSTATWSSLGALYARQAVRLGVAWHQHGQLQDLPPLDHWLAFELRPGEKLRRRLWVVAPVEPGRWELSVELVQHDFPRPLTFTELGGEALETQVSVAGPKTWVLRPPGPMIFADGFESGTLSAWSAVEP